MHHIEQTFWRSLNNKNAENGARCSSVALAEGRVECAVGTLLNSKLRPPDRISTEIRVRGVTDFGRATPSLRQPTPRCLILIVARELRE